MKSLGLKIMAIIVTVIILFQANMNIVVAATTSTELEKEQKETKDKIQETENELKNVEKEKTETKEQVEELSSQISNYQTQIETLNHQISELNTKIRDSEDKLKKAEEDYTKQEDLLEKRLVATYEAGETSYLDFLLSSESITDFISNYFLVTEVATSDTELLEKIQKQKQEIEQTKKELEEDKQKLATSKANKEGLTAQLQTVKKEKDQQVAQLSKEEQVLQQEIEELKAHEESIKGQIEEWKRQYDSRPKPNDKGNNNTGNNGNTGTSNNNSTSSYGFGWPVSNNRIGTRYGVKGNMWSLGYHTGVDFPVSKGTPVYAVGEGQVVDTGYNSAYGNFVEIYHGNNVYSFYAHATTVQVSKGQIVLKGQQIMISGATGNVSGPHLHFEIRSPGSGFYSCVNPMSYLP